MFVGGKGGVGQLRHDAQAVFGVTSQGIGVEAVFGFELAELEAGAAITQFVAQHAECTEGAQLAVGGVGIDLAQLGSDPFEEVLFRALRVEFAVFLPLLVLGLLDETEHVFCIQCQLAVVTGG